MCNSLQAAHHRGVICYVTQKLQRLGHEARITHVLREVRRHSRGDVRKDVKEGFVNLSAVSVATAAYLCEFLVWCRAAALQRGAVDSVEMNAPCSIPVRIFSTWRCREQKCLSTVNKIVK
ncbi:hypothetical protein TRVL_08520 [Trypanosoma vivax]|nr:hypothetical protein TRVL_08520 [Trypanosoma vivax]